MASFITPKTAIEIAEFYERREDEFHAMADAAAICDHKRDFIYDADRMGTRALLWRLRARELENG